MTRTKNAGLALCALLAGCSLALDPSRYQGGDGGSGDGVDGGPRDGGGGDADAPEDGGGSDAGDGGTVPSCSGGLTCEPGAPAGWSGPIVLVTGPGDAAAPSCPATAPSTAFTTRSAMTAAPADCGCACTPPSAAAMSCGSGTLQTIGSSFCAALGTNHSTLADGECRSIPSLPTSGRWTVSSPPFSTSATGCTPAPSTTLPPITWGASHRGCGIGTPVGCGDAQVCVPPREAGERLCVYVDGDAACPPAFPVSLATAEDATEGRSCSACSCGAIEGSCGGAINIASSCAGGGGTILYASVGVGSCTVPVSAPTPYASANFVPTATCPPSATAPTGEVTPTTVRTVCCVE